MIQEVVWCNKDDLRIVSDIVPCTIVRKPLPSDSKAVRISIKKKPYLNKRYVVFDIRYLDAQYRIPIEKGFCWDGATCLGLHHLPKFLNPSMLHDKLCNEHLLIDNNRYLSSLIFKEMCIASGINKIFAIIAFYVIDNYQKLFGKDMRGNKWNNKEK